MASLSFISAQKLAELLRSTDKNNAMYVRILNEDQLALGIDPLQPSCLIDLSNEIILPVDTCAIQPVSYGSSTEVPRVNGKRVARRSGDHWFELRNNRVECGSLKELLGEALRSLERIKPGTLESLSRVRGRSRRIVARSPNQLFEKEHLAREYAEKLNDDWYYGTNNSARETDAWLRRAAEIAGLRWGVDFASSTDLPPLIEDLI